MINLTDARRVRAALEQALVLLDGFERARGALDQRVLDLLRQAPDGISARRIRFILRRRSSDVNKTLRLLAAAGSVYSDETTRRWKVVDDGI